MVSNVTLAQNNTNCHLIITDYQKVVLKKSVDTNFRAIPLASVIWNILFCRLVSQQIRNTKYLRQMKHLTKKLNTKKATRFGLSVFTTVLLVGRKNFSRNFQENRENALDKSRKHCQQSYYEVMSLI